MTSLHDGLTASERIREARMTTESERVIARAQRLAPMLRERVYVYSNGREVWLAAASTARELYADRVPIFTAAV